MNLYPGVSQCSIVGQMWNNTVATDHDIMYTGANLYTHAIYQFIDSIWIVHIQLYVVPAKLTNEINVTQKVIKQSLTFSVAVSQMATP